MKIIDFIEPKKVKDIIEEIDSTLSDVGLAKLIEKLIYRYDKVASKKMTEIENNQIVSDGPSVLRFCFLTGLTSVSEETFNFISLNDSLEKFSDSSEKKRLPFLILKLSFIDSST